jgi:hypothetical protein
MLWRHQVSGRSRGKTMTIEEAANALAQRLSGASWLTAIGTGTHAGRPCIFLYVSRLNVDLSFLKDGWEGYCVQVRKMGSIRPVSGSPSAPV